MDESPTSWLIRLARSHHNAVSDLLNFYNLNSLFKRAIDIDTDLTVLKNILQERSGLPQNVVGKIPDFKWKNGRSEWIIFPNKKGSSTLNSFTQYCPKCLTTKGYYQLKWKLVLFTGCVDCGCELQNSCPNCLSPISPLKSDIRYPVHLDINPIFTCWNCTYDYRETPLVPMDVLMIEIMSKINRAYNENPVNDRYLEYLLFNKVSFDTKSILLHKDKR